MGEIDVTIPAGARARKFLIGQLDGFTITKIKYLLISSAKDCVGDVESFTN